MSGSPSPRGSHHAQYIGTGRREHAPVATGGVRTATKVLGLRNLENRAGQRRLGHRRRDTAISAATTTLTCAKQTRTRSRYRLWHIPGKHLLAPALRPARTRRLNSTIGPTMRSPVAVGNGRTY
jgi:hypothetical protein